MILSRTGSYSTYTPTGSTPSFHIFRKLRLLQDILQCRGKDSFHTLNISSVWTDHSLDQCLTYSYLVSLMSSPHQMGIVLCHCHEEKLVAGEPILTAKYMSQPFLELDHHPTVVVPIIFDRKYLHQYNSDQLIIQGTKVAIFSQGIYVIDK